MAVLDAVLALHNAQSANVGELLSLYRYYPGDDADSTCRDASGNGLHGTWVGSPSLRQPGPGENVADYSVQFGSTKYADLGQAGNVRSALSGRGLFVMWAAKHGSTADRDTVLASRNAGQTEGFRIAFNMQQTGLGTGPGIGMFMNTVSGSGFSGTCHIDQFVGNTTSMVADGSLWNFHCVYMKQVGLVHKYWVNGMPKPITATSNSGTLGTLASSTDKLFWGADGAGATAGPDFPDSGEFMAHLVIGEGEPTQRQIRDILRQMFYTVKRVPGVVAHWRPSPSTCFKTIGPDVAAAVGDEVRKVLDISGHGNHLVNNNASRVPTLQRSVNGQAYTLCFDNHFSNWGEYLSLGLQKQQTLDLGTDAAYSGSGTLQTNLYQYHVGAIGMTRPMNSHVRFKGQQLLMMRDAAGTLYSALGLSGDEPAISRVSRTSLGANMPKQRCLPGLGVMGFCTGLVGDMTNVADSMVINNRFQSTMAQAVFGTGGQGSTQNRLTKLSFGGSVNQAFNGGGQDMWAGLVDEYIITRFGITPDEADDYVTLAFAEAGEMKVPAKHFTVVGDSIAAGFGNDLCRAMLSGALPALAASSASWCQASVGSMAYDDFTVSYDTSISQVQRGYGFSTYTHPTLGTQYRWADPEATNFALIQTCVNSANQGDSQAQAYGVLWTNGANISVNPLTSPARQGLIDQLNAMGCTGRVFAQLPTDNGNNANVAAALQQLKTEGRIAKLVTLTPLIPLSLYYSGNLHPLPAGSIIWSNNWWEQALAGEFGAPTNRPSAPVMQRMRAIGAAR